jgi:chemotaxis protein methyltransferase CheR
VCRNVTIYFDEAATQRLYRTLISALAPGGWLMLGPSDPMPAERDELDRVETDSAVLWRRQPQTQRPAVLRRSSTLSSATRAPDKKAARQIAKPKSAPLITPGNGRAELEAGLLALEAGSCAAALEWLRRATFRNPHSPLGQFALARAYLGVGDAPRAQAALLHTQRLLAALQGETFVPETDAMAVETLRQAVQTHLTAMDGARA